MDFRCEKGGRNDEGKLCTRRPGLPDLRNNHCQCRQARHGGRALQ
jgi:hypothetical protein